MKLDERQFIPVITGFSTLQNYTPLKRSKVTHRDPAKYVRYYADGLLEKLSEVCERYNTTSWTDLPDLNIFMHDGATSNICFTFEGGLRIVIGSGKQYPEHFREMYQEFNGLIEESKNYGVDVEVKEVASGMTMGMMFGPPEEFVKLQDYSFSPLQNYTPLKQIKLGYIFMRYLMKKK